MIEKVRVFLVLCVSVIATSCNFTENINLNSDGSGKISFDVDASAIMEMGGEEMIGKGKSEVIDSTFTFKELLAQKKDSIAKLPAAEQAKLKKMENFAVNMKINESEKTFFFSLFSDFKSTMDLVDMMTVMKSIDELKSKGKGSQSPISKMEDGNTELRFSFNGKKFSRTVKVKDAVLQKQIVDSLGSIRPMLAAFNYTVKYHFPKKIKSVSAKNALFSEDRKTVTIQFPFLDYVEKPESMSFDVFLENK